MENRPYSDINNIDFYDIPNGKGKRLTKEQKIIKYGYEYLNKLIDYEEKEKICGEDRNSYYKTDKDATAMVLKEDYYSKLSHDFHAAYNTQVIVSSGFITMFPVAFGERLPHVDLNYLKENENTNSKVKKKSRIDIFNERLAKSLAN